MRALARVLIWVAATAAATALAWAGVRSVVTEVSAPLPAAPLATVGVPLTPRPDRPTPPASDSASTRTFEVEGGTATVRFAEGGVEVLGAVPAAGFAVDVEAEDGGTRVEFESERHRSRLRLWWQDGPRHEVTEERRDDDDAREPDDEPHDDGQRDDRD